MIIKDEFKLDPMVLQYINSDAFEWHYSPFSSSPTFPVMMHTLVNRGSGGADPYVGSDQFDQFFWKTQLEPAIGNFAQRNNLEIEGISRACLNLTMATNGQFPVGDKHVDDGFDHMVLVAYLNDDCSGDTVIYDKKWQEGDPQMISVFDDDGSIPVKESITPKVGTCVCFDGRYYHANTFPQLGEKRIVCVVNFTIKK